jgi:hypothetical protein
MDSAEAARIVGSAATVSDKIRALDAAGYPRAEIARLLGKRYQHVRNVLEADKLPRSGPVDVSAPCGGVREPSAAFGKTVRLEVDAGMVRFPNEVLAALGSGLQGVLIAELQDGRLVIFGAQAARERVRAKVAKLNIAPGRRLSEELIAERRLEAAREFPNE